LLTMDEHIAAGCPSRSKPWHRQGWSVPGDPCSHSRSAEGSSSACLIAFQPIVKSNTPEADLPISQVTIPLRTANRLQIFR
jgi:hypothetical protein